MTEFTRRKFIAGAGSAILGANLPLQQVLAATTPTTQVTRTVVAAYFGGWSNPMDKSQQWLHGDNAWGTYPNSKFPNVKHSMGKYPDRFPTLAPYPAGYDDNQQAIVEAEAKTAATYGVDVFSFNWYRDDFLNIPIMNFKKSTKKSGMKWFLQWSNNSNGSVTPPADSREFFFEGIRRAAIHMRDGTVGTAKAPGDKSYWTQLDPITQKQLPVFAIFDVSQINRIVNATYNASNDVSLKKVTARATSFVAPNITQSTAEHDAFLWDCQQIVANVFAGDETGGITLLPDQPKGTYNIAVVKRNGVAPKSVAISLTKEEKATYKPAMYLMLSTPDVGNWAACTAVHGLYCYNIRQGNFPNAAGKVVSRLAHSYTEMMTACQQNYDLYMPAMKNFAPTKAYWATAMAGFDMKPWGGSPSDPLSDNCVSTKVEFEAHCQQVRKALDAYPTVTGGVSFIYAWNEFGEGGFIAPTRSLGDSRLASVKKNLS